MSWEGVKIRLRNGYIRATAAARQKKLKNKTFTVISNNCWGGLVYESYGLEKQSPTVGAYFAPEEYLRFLSRLEYYLKECEMTFVPPQDARHKDLYMCDKRFGTFPIARVGDVEIAMLHYHSEEEARQKWERRCKRVNWDRLIVKMNDQNGCTREQAEAFLQLPFENKVFFTVRDLDGGEGCVRLPYGGESVLSTQEPFGASRYLNVNQLINSL